MSKLLEKKMPFFSPHFFFFFFNQIHTVLIYLPNSETQITYGKNTRSALEENIQNIHSVVCAPNYLDCQVVQVLTLTYTFFL